MLSREKCWAVSIKNWENFVPNPLCTPLLTLNAAGHSLIFAPANRANILTSVEGFFVFKQPIKKMSNYFKNPLFPEPFDSRAKAPPAKRWEKGYEDENVYTIAVISCEADISSSCRALRFSYQAPAGYEIRKGLWGQEWVNASYFATPSFYARFCMVSCNSQSRFELRKPTS